jgi:transposase
MSQSKRTFSPEYRIEIAQRIERGESVSKLHRELDIKRSVLYRWRDALRKEGPGGLARAVGRPPGVPNPATPKPGVSAEEALRQQIAALERKVGQQALQLDFFKRAFKRVKESSQPSASTGATASTRRSGK